jgi:broad specificity phosphatase PhoE
MEKGMKSLRALVTACALLLMAAQASAQQVISVVRHAERASAPSGQTATAGMMADDPPITPAGEQRAARLASMLASAGIRHVFTSEYLRTRQTAAPLAAKLGLTPAAVPAKDPDALLARIRGADGNVLVVGHSNTVPDLLKKLGVSGTVTIADGDYDNLFVVFRDGDKATLTTLKY